MAKKWIPASRVEGDASRQAHADFPEGTYEREISKEGFFGPAAFLHHKNPPTGWTDFEGPLRPRAFNLIGVNDSPNSPWDAPVVLHHDLLAHFGREPLHRVAIQRGDRCHAAIVPRAGYRSLR